MDRSIKTNKHLALGGATLVCALLVSMLCLAQPEAPLSAQVVAMTETLPPTRPTLPQTLPPTREPTPTTTATPRPVHLPLTLRQARKVENGTFESGSLTPWRQAGDLPITLVDAPVHAGLRAAQLGSPHYDNWGGCPVGNATISQIIDVPRAGYPELHLWYRIYSYDTVEFDYFGVDVAPYPHGSPERLWLDGGYFWSPGVLWNSGWREATITLDNYRGQTIMVQLYTAMTNEDGYYNTWTVVDDVSLVVGY